MQTVRVKFPQDTTILQDNLIMNIYPILRNNLFQGDLAIECEVCDKAGGSTNYVSAVQYAIRHVAEHHPEIIVIQEGNEVTFNE